MHACVQMWFESMLGLPQLQLVLILERFAKNIESLIGVLNDL